MNSDSNMISKTGAEKINPYDDVREKHLQVEEMFDSIAPAYDFMNNAMSFGLHRVWRNRALKYAIAAFEDTPPANALDIATGTGDVAFELHKRLPDTKIVGIDLSEGMLKIAKAKLANMSVDAGMAVSFEKGDSLDLPMEDNSVDLITVAYGVRNFENLAKGYSEMRRVLRKDGVLCVIELSEPANSAMKSLYRVYARYIIPIVGRLVSRDSRAYSYLPQSIAAAPQRDRMIEVMKRAGFNDCKFKSLTFGVATYYLAVK